jgi:hypothetical protein
VQLSRDRQGLCWLVAENASAARYVLKTQERSFRGLRVLPIGAQSVNSQGNTLWPS